jgi:CcmD family protein
MDTLVSAYVFAWVVVTGYLTWLAVQNRRLGRRLDELERTRPGAVKNRSLSKAA